MNGRKYRLILQEHFQYRNSQEIPQLEKLIRRIVVQSTENHIPNLQKSTSALVRPPNQVHKFSLSHQSLTQNQDHHSQAQPDHLLLILDQAKVKELQAERS